MKKLYQSPDGAVNVNSTPYLEYTYSTTIMGRLVSAKYPSGKTLTYNYDTNGRVTSIQEGTQTIVSYGLTGSGNMLQTQYTVPGLSLDYTSGGLDRFQRITDHAWKKNSVNMVQIKHDYDYNGNRLNRQDTLNTTGSELYAYDGINQITSFKRGTLNAARTEIASPSFAETWNHDKTGNWTSFASGGTTQNRTHSKANEIASIGGSATNVGADKNGNMTKVTKPESATSNFALTFDAWNRITTVKGGTTTVATYNYNGLNHRVKKTIGSVVTRSTFNENWQELESVTGSETLVYVWGLRYVDDLVYRQRDTEKIYSMVDPTGT